MCGYDTVVFPLSDRVQPEVHHSDTDQCFAGQFLAQITRISADPIGYKASSPIKLTSCKMPKLHFGGC